MNAEEFLRSSFCTSQQRKW